MPVLTEAQLLTRANEVFTSGIPDNITGETARLFMVDMINSFKAMTQSQKVAINEIPGDSPLVERPQGVNFFVADSDFDGLVINSYKVKFGTLTEGFTTCAVHLLVDGVSVHNFTHTDDSVLSVTQSINTPVAVSDGSVISIGITDLTASEEDLGLTATITLVKA